MNFFLWICCSYIKYKSGNVVKIGEPEISSNKHLSPRSMLGLTILMLIMIYNAYNAYFNIVIGCKLQQERAGLYGKLKGQFKELGAEIASFFFYVIYWFAALRLQKRNIILLKEKRNNMEQTTQWLRYCYNVMDIIRETIHGLCKTF